MNSPNNNQVLALSREMPLDAHLKFLDYTTLLYNLFTEIIESRQSLEIIGYLFEQSGLVNKEKRTFYAPNKELDESKIDFIGTAISFLRSFRRSIIGYYELRGLPTSSTLQEVNQFEDYLRSQKALDEKLTKEIMLAVTNLSLYLVAIWKEVTAINEYFILLLGPDVYVEEDLNTPSLTNADGPLTFSYPYAFEPLKNQPPLKPSPLGLPWD